METLDVEPAVLLKVEDFAEFMVNFSVMMRPYACFFEFKQRVHSCSEKVGAIFSSKESQKGFHGVLHGFFEKFRRFEWSISLYFHDM